MLKKSARLFEITVEDQVKGTTKTAVQSLCTLSLNLILRGFAYRGSIRLVLFLRRHSGLKRGINIDRDRQMAEMFLDERLHVFPVQSTHPCG